MKQFLTLLTIVLLALPTFAIKTKAKSKKPKMMSEQQVCEKLREKADQICEDSLDEECEAETGEACYRDGDFAVIVQECSYEELQAQIEQYNEQTGRTVNCDDY